MAATRSLVVGQADDPAMRLQDLLERQDPFPAAGADPGALRWLERRLDDGDRALSASWLPGGLGPWPGPVVLVEIEGSGERVRVPVALDAEAARRLRTRLPDLPVDGAPALAAPASGASTPTGLAAELHAVIRRSEPLPPDERAAALMDWAMERIDASRCALVPFESGTPGPPLVFRARSGPADATDPKRIPRRILAHVARTRQPKTSHAVGAADGSRLTEETAVRQQVRSYLAVPVVFRGDLLAVCYVDRFDEPRRFTDEERAIFEAFAYELAWPLLDIRDQQRRQEYRELRDVLLAEGPDAAGARIATSPAFQATLDRAEKLAPYPSESLLLLGETGSGKEVVARFVHERSDRAHGPFVAVNVSAVPAELFESELMGSARGAFTGAVDRPGRIADADGGTLFLDEIGDLALQNQVKLLRFLQDKRIHPVGGRGPRAVDVRIVAATNRPIADLVKRGEFREDLLHRFAPPIRVPPLRERKEEIVPHARAWLRTRARQAGMPAPRLTPEAEEFLLSYPWPGNVRQLEAVVSHAVLLASNARISRSLLESLVPATPTSPGVPRTWEEWRSWRDDREREWLARIIEDSGGKVATAARAIEVPLSTLRSLLKRHGIRE